MKKKNPDAELIAMIERHDQLWDEWGWIKDGDPRIADIGVETTNLEYEIMATPPLTPKGAATKNRWTADHADIVYGLDMESLVATMLEFDAKRIAAGMRRRADAERVAAIPELEAESAMS
jgi:hypothetical protein